MYRQFLHFTVPIAALSLGVASAAFKAPDRLLQQALDADRNGPTYRYDLEYESDDLAVLVRVDPTEPQGERVEVLRSDQPVLIGEIVEGVADLEADPTEEFWCANWARRIPRNAGLIGETWSSATYTFKPLPDPDDPDDEKLMKYLIGEVTIAKQDPQILSVVLKSFRPFKPIWIAKIDRFEMSIECERTDDGRTYVAQRTLSVDGEAALQTVRERARRKISNVTPVAQ